MSQLFDNTSSLQEILEISNNLPDANNMVTTEPAEDDIPKVFIDGEIPVTKDEVLAELAYISKTERFKSYIKIKCQGASSMTFPKKNFTVKLYSDEARKTKMPKLFKDWGIEANKFCLKANFVDHSHARNIVSANIWSDVISNREDYEFLPENMKTSPRNGAVDGFPIRVFLNGVYEGLYTWNIPKDAWMWNMDENNPNHVLLGANTFTAEQNSCNFSALWDGADGKDWEFEVGTASDAVTQSFNALITCVKDANDDTFVATIGNYLDVQSAIDYCIHMTLISGFDNVSKNLLMATYDLQKWYCGAYDMDGTFGLMALGQGFESTDRSWPVSVNITILWTRIMTLFADQMKQRYLSLRNTIYSESYLVNKFETFVNKIGDALYEQDLEIFPSIPSGYTNNIKQIRSYIRDRLIYMDDLMRGTPLYPMQNGTKTFSDGAIMTTTADGTITLETPEDSRSLPWSLTISNINQNSSDRTDGYANRIGKPTLFTLNAGDVITTELTSKTDIQNDNVLIHLYSSGYSAVILKLSESPVHHATKIVRTTVVESSYDVGVVALRVYLPGLVKAELSVRIFVNGVRYI